jgi:hypothetical protein
MPVESADVSSISGSQESHFNLNNILTDERDANGGYRALVIDGPGSYYVGIIDILQSWNWAKITERFFKIYIQRLDPDGISAMHPDPYAERFFERCVIDTFEGMDDIHVRATASGKVSRPCNPETLVDHDEETQ